MSVHPNYKWADKKDTVWVTAEIPYVKKENVKVILDPAGKLSLNVNIKDKKYSMELQLNGRIRVEVFSPFLYSIFLILYFILIIFPFINANFEYVI